MTGGDLIAMIPTDEDFAHTRKPPADGWKMPYKDLYIALKKFTNNRIARADFAKKDMPKIFDDPSKAASDPEFAKFVEQLHFSAKPLLPSMKSRPMFVECVVPF